ASALVSTSSGSGGTSTATGSQTFDQNGQFSAPPPLTIGSTVPTNKSTNPIYTVELDPKSGVLKMTFSQVALIKGLGANFKSFKSTIPIHLVLGTAASVQPSSSQNPQNPSATPTPTVD